MTQRAQPDYRDHCALDRAVESAKLLAIIMSGPRAALPRLTDRLRLGGTQLEVSPFCLGRVDQPDTIAAAFDAGINFFFVSADMHWPLYEASRVGLGALLARGGAVRDRIVVAL